MRITNQSSNTNEENENNKFGAFSCPSESRQQQSSLAPSKAALLDMPKSRTNKRRIIMSDDEEENEVVHVRTPKNKNKVSDGTPSSVEWVDTRKPSVMTYEERQHNVQAAIENRKQHGINVKIPKIISKIPKVKYTTAEPTESDDDDILNQATPYANKAALQSILTNKPSTNKYKSNLLNETFNEEQEEFLEMKKNEREQNRTQRHDNRAYMNRTFVPKSDNKSPEQRLSQSGEILLTDIYASRKSNLDVIDLEDSDQEVPVRKSNKLINSRLPTIKSSKKKEVMDVEEDKNSSASDSDGSSSGSEPGYRSDMDKSEVQALAHRVVRQCEELSLNLRRSLTQWETGDHKESTTAAAGSSGNCIDLTSIRPLENNNSPNKQLLNEEDIAQLCPALRLKGYQLVGVNWLKLLHQNNVNGVLADDMGLGKTIQTIAFLGWLASLRPNTSTVTGPGSTSKLGSTAHPHLIVVPASTLSNWEIELHRHCPALKVLIYHGSQNERATLRYEIRAKHTLPDVILSTYTIFERESNKADRAFMNAQHFDYLVLDEAHGIKNAQSSRFLNLNSLKTKHRLLLSGTPVQNDISELLSMLSFLMPQVFGRGKRDILIEALNCSTAGVTASTSASTASSNQGELSIVHLRSMLAPFVLRRLKRDVLDQLTEKTIIVQRLAMTVAQQEVYDNILLGHATRKEVLKVRKQAEQKAELVFEDRARSRVSSNTALNATPTPTPTPAIPMIDLTSPVAEVGSSSSTAVDLCVSPFNKKKHHTAARQLSHSDANAVADSASIHSAHSSSSGASSRKSGLEAQGPVFPSEIDLAALAKESVNSADIDPVSAAAVDDQVASKVIQQLSTTEANHLFTALRKAANHPLLLRVRYKEEKMLEKIAMISHSMGHFGHQCDYQRVRDEIDGMSDFDLHQLCLEYEALHSLQLDASALYDSPKMRLLQTLLPQLQAEGHRILVFSQWTRLLDLLEVLLQDISLSYLRLDGSTPVKTRQDLINTYNTDTSIPVFLLSTKAGGLGINLTAADTVILHDLDFNPENDRQAEDRCHRIGQTRPVTVYKLFSQDSVDEAIFELGERKSKLSKAVLQDDRRQQQQPQGKKGKSRVNNPGDEQQAAEDDDDPSTAISSILQKALLKRVQQYNTNN